MGLFSWLFYYNKRTSLPSASSLERDVAPSEEVVISGRTHLATLAYIFPKDQQENDRLNFQHYVLYQMLGSHIVAPIGEQQAHILDVGTGTGKWAMDIAKLFPHAQVIGLDVKQAVSVLSPPPNYTFRRGNVLERLPFQDRTFSYVHQRLLVGAIPERQWTDVIQELVRVTAYEGYIELVEGGDQYIKAGPATTQFLSWGRDASTSIGINASCMSQKYLENLLMKSGLHHVAGRTIQVPLGWEGRTGALLAKDMLAAFQNLQGFFVPR